MVTRLCPLSRRHDVKGGELLHGVPAVVFEAVGEGEADQRAAPPEVATERRRGSAGRTSSGAALASSGAPTGFERGSTGFERGSAGRLLFWGSSTI